jgi:hypothetical protein
MEQIDYKPDEIAQLRSKIEVDVPMELHWQWDYLREIEDLRSLYEKGKAGQWNAETDLDWRTPVPADEFSMKPEDSLMANVLGMVGMDQKAQMAGQHQELAWGLSQLLHGEQAALQLCAQLVNVCPEMDQKFYAGSQVIDEVRHCETFGKLLQRKFGKIYPIEPNLKFLLDTLLTVETWQKKCVGMQLLFESVAVGIFDQLQEASLNPLLKQALYRITQDESRHAAFGVLSMRKVLPTLSQNEREDLEDFAFNVIECFHRGQLLGQLKDLLPPFGLDPENLAMAILSDPQYLEKNNVIFNHMMPNLKNLGLITERTRAGYAQLGLS